MLIESRKIGFIFFLWVFLFQSIPNSFALGIDFIETASFNQDGSGQFSMKIDLTKTSNLISIIKFLNKDYNGITKSIGYQYFNNLSENFKKIPDITQVSVTCNEKMLTLELSFSFNHVQALNKAMCKINKGLDPPKITYFSLDDELFIREDVNGIAKKLLFYQQYDSCLVKSLDLASFFKESTYTTIYTFPNKSIESFSNPLSRTTEDQHKIYITHHIFAPDEIEDSIGNRVHFAKD